MPVTGDETSAVLVYGLVLLAALLHATWNAFVKAGGDKLVVQALVVAGHLPVALLLLPYATWLPPLGWLCILASVAIHTLYFWSLVSAYKVGDLSQVYPIARGSAPLLVALGAFFLVGETLSVPELLGLGLLSSGLISLAWRRRKKGEGPLADHGKTVLLALATGVTIGGYSLVDGVGARASGSALSYIFWLLLLEPLPFLFAAIHLRGWSFTAFKPYLKTGLGGGVISAVAYGIVIWAMSVAPLAHVIALRETSVVLAAAIGMLFLGEGFGPHRIAAAVLVACGAILLRIGGAS